MRRKKTVFSGSAIVSSISLCRRTFFFLVVCLVVAPTAWDSCAIADSAADTQSRDRLAQRLEPFYRVWSGKQDRFAVHVQANVKIKDKVEPVEIRVAKFDDASFDFIATHPDYALEVYRRESVTSMVLPRHQRTFVGEGEWATKLAQSQDHLAPLGLATRLTSSGSMMGTFVKMLSLGDAKSLLTMASSLVKIEQLDGEASWRLGGNVELWFDEENGDSRLNLRVDDNQATISLAADPVPANDKAWTSYEQVTVSREEMETQFARGIRRAWEVIWPSAELTHASQVAKQVEHGELQYVDGQRLVLLAGTPEQIGKAHGELLKIEAQHCIDSVLNAFGTVQTINTGRWFRHDLAAAYKRLKPHIPADHIAETRALAISLGQSPELLEELNVFPELFHCSGFAVFNSATTDGKLYHGRVLDYMTTIGLQDSATTFVVAVDGKIPFANVGYAGFTGSVSGMNKEAISLGEMGGRGEGQWDGVPMATLMRRALEECSTLKEVTDLWTKSPRTCEYYYVFADGKTNDAVGVAATPDKIELIGPGQFDERLGEGIADSVVLSAGDRLTELRKRVTENHGKIDTEIAMWLMSRPVAMSSNLHNVLFIPADGVFYVANASHSLPAAERPYVKFELNKLVK